VNALGHSEDSSRAIADRSKETIILVYFSYSGIGSVVAVALQETFRHVFFVKEVLANFDGKHEQNQPKKHSRNTFVYLDNATPHWASLDFDRLGIRKFIHPPYRPDLSLRLLATRNL
jgi:hypothetical protein